MSRFGLFWMMTISIGWGLGLAAKDVVKSGAQKVIGLFRK